MAIRRSLSQVPIQSIYLVDSKAGATTRVSDVQAKVLHAERRGSTIENCSSRWKRQSLEPDPKEYVV